ncbi:MAG: hypothetical protein C0601_01930 [Candidatus Muiribacterium halophilum]|uniref:YgjP-like metallopeptidase domain-containing protein n=1 Tax=Muiribacterium halophilum TaxID=2053465 RepID=A0A2N5ZL30_MUIH1|nr:MAG: hypothetical protein C0601_01930 [Candidatus Muirbacterium halophilum]
MQKIKINRKNIKNTYIRVNQDGTVLINCPKRATQDYINGLLEKRESWIQKRLVEIETKKRIQRENVDRILFLGKYYNQQEIRSEDSCIRLIDDTFYFYMHRIPFDSLKACMLEKFKEDRLKEIVKKYLNEYISKTGLIPETIEYKKMRSRWGYCQSNKKRIVFSSELINKPKEFIEYVVLHEICHLKIPSHGKRFYKLLERYMVDYKEKRKHIK